MLRRGPFCYEFVDCYRRFAVTVPDALCDCFRTNVIDGIVTGCFYIESRAQ